MAAGQQPILLLKEDTERERGQDAQKNNIAAAKGIGDIVRTTLGPKGMDKMLVDSIGDIVITNDGVSILKEMDIEHPAAKMVVEVAESQEEECGDGTTSAVVIAAEMLKKAEELLDKDVHPSTIAKGFRLASQKAPEILDDLKVDIDMDSEEPLINIATTAMTGKSIEMNKHKLAEIAVKAIKKVAEETDTGPVVDMDNVKIEKKAGASIDNTKLIDGILLDKDRLHNSMPKDVKDAKIALLNSALEIKETEVDASIEITSPDQMQDFVDEEEKRIQEMVQKVKESGADVLLCQKGIDDLAQHYLAKEDIFAIRRVKKSDMKRLAKSTGGTIVNNLNDLQDADLGHAERVEERLVADSHMTFVEGAEDGKAVSLLLRGGTEHVVDELERAVEDALKVVGVAIEDGAALPGGGAVEIELSNKMKNYASKVEGREQLSVEAFADALDIIPRTISENAGMDGIDVLMELNTAHEKDGLKHHGVNVEDGGVGDMIESKVLEPYRVKNQAVQSATEVANLILRIDDVVASKGGGDEGGGPPAGGPGGAPGGGMPGGMGGGMPGMM